MRGHHVQLAVIMLASIAIAQFASADSAEVAAAKLPSARALVSSVGSGSDVYLFGGQLDLWEDPSRSAAAFTNQIVKFSQAEGTASVLPTRLPVALGGTCAARLGDKAYIFGGHDGTADSKRVIEFSIPDGGVRTLSAQLTQGAYRCAAATAGSKIYVLGGYDSSTGGMQRTDAVLEFNPATGSLTPLSVAATLAGRAIASDGTNVFVFGHNSPRDVGKLSTGAGTFEVTSARLPDSFEGADSAAFDGNLIYIFAGRNIATFSPATGIVTPLTSELPGRQSWATASCTDSACFVFGGRLNTGSYQITDQISKYLASPTEIRSPLATSGPGAGQITVEWQPPTPGLPVDGYRIYAKAGGFLQTVTTTQYVVEGLGPGVTGSFEVASYNRYGESRRTEVVGRTFDVPHPPADVRTAPGPAVGALRITWIAPTNNGGMPIQGYRIYDGASRLDQVPPNVTSWTRQDLGNDYAATYQVVGFNAVGESARVNVSVETFSAPRVNFTFSPLKPGPGKTVRFEDASVNRGLNLTRWAWDFGDGQTGSGRVAEHAYARKGEFDVTLTVTNELGMSSSSRRSLHVDDLLPPIAAFTATSNLLRVEVDGRNSTDSDGTIVAMSWDWGDGSATDSGRTSRHTYRAAGKYAITLTATDDSDLEGKTSREIVVFSSLSPPTAEFTAERDGLTVTVDATKSSSPNGRIVSYAWDWGDGTTGTGERSSHAYSSPGDFRITLRVADAAGEVAEKGVDVTPKAGAPGPSLLALIVALIGVSSLLRRSRR